MRLSEPQLQKLRDELRRTAMFVDLAIQLQRERDPELEFVEDALARALMRLGRVIPSDLAERVVAGCARVSA